MSDREAWSPLPADERRSLLARAFRDRYGRSPEGIAEAPGRVNLIGEHVDYNGGSVLPVAIDRRALVAFARRDDPEIQVASEQFDGVSTFRLGSQLQDRARSAWSDYILGVVAVLTETQNVDFGVDVLVAGDVPLGAGLSSSAALEVAVAGALREVWRLDLDDKQLALLCRRAENEFVGVQCGVMDQLAAALGRQGHALLIDCMSLEIEHIPLSVDEQGVALVVVDSGQRRRLEESAYNRRREECAEALQVIRDAVPGPPESLGGASTEDLKRAPLPAQLLRRARHVITECGRVESAVQALRCGDLPTLGALMNESHASLRDDFEVSTPELDSLVELARAVPGVLGARLTGAGFGGCTVNLVRASALEEFHVNVVERFVAEARLPARTMVCRASDGLRVERVP